MDEFLWWDRHNYGPLSVVSINDTLLHRYTRLGQVLFYTVKL